MSTDLFDLIDDWGPEKVISVSDRRSGMRGVLVIDNTARGLGKGGTRMSTTVTVVEIARLARAMTWKWAAVNLFHGGAKAGILGDPSAPNKEGILRAFARALRNEVPAEYAFGLDVGLNETDAAVFLDELGDRGAATGLPRELGGLPYDQLGVTGFGVAEAADAAAQVCGVDMETASVAIQGFGAVGRAAALQFVALGARITAVSTSLGSVVDEDGLDIARLQQLHDDLGDACVLEYGNTQPLETALESAVDILVPAATQDVIDQELAARLDVRLIVEGANLPTTPAAQQVLHERGISLVPDFIANAGGIVAAAHSMDARYSPFAVEPSRVLTMISQKMRENTDVVLTESLRRGETPHHSARQLAQQRVLDAMRARRQVPTERGI